MKLNITYIALFLLVFISCNSNAANFKRLSILIDDGLTERPEPGAYPAMAMDFGAIIDQKASPVLVTYAVANTFLKMKFEKTKYQDQFFLLLKRKFEENKFTLNEWLIFHCKVSQMLLFVPKSMKWMIEDSTLNINDTRVTISAFKRNIFEQFDENETSPETLISWAYKKYEASMEAADSLLDAAQITKMFLNDKDMLELAKSLDIDGSGLEEKMKLIRSLSIPWNIFISGHGSSKKSHGIERIAGMPPIELQKILLFLNKIHTNFVALSSCYSGGENLDFLLFKDRTKQGNFVSNLDFILAVISSQDSSCLTLASTSYTSFFNELEAMQGANFLTKSLRVLAAGGYSESDGKIVNIPQILIPHVGWFQAFSPVKTSQKENIENPDIFTLGKAAMVKYELEGKEINIASKRVVLLYPEIVVVPIFISKKNRWDRGVQSILSMQKGDAVHILSSISTGTDDLLDFLQEAFFNPNLWQESPRTSKKTFLIKELRGNGLSLKKYLDSSTTLEEADSDRLTLNNVLIYSFGASHDAKTVVCRIIFRCQKKYYVANFDIFSRLWRIEQINEDSFNDQLEKHNYKSLDKKYTKYLNAVKKRKSGWQEMMKKRTQRNL